ncbi:hypothetical protein WJX74_009969 [Apatococcus lobatus]|uniref:UDP-glycosyltransferases domain-containing protein n=1 Tax=Apatococcus lobatus TaxID=904363 RepID=A0AAW1QX09_9CHLO
MKRGHNFTMLMSSGDELGQARLARKPFDALRKLNFSGPPDVGTETWLRQLKRDPVKDFEWIRQTGLSLARSLLADKECFAALKADNYDLILRDTIGWQTQLLSKMLEVPEVDILTAGVALPLLGPRYSIPNRIAYIPQMGSLLPSVMTFKQRLQNYAWYLLFRYAIMAGKSTEERQLAESYGYDLDSSWLPRSTAPALIAGGDWALEYPMPLPPKVQLVGPLLASPAKPLPQAFQTFLDETVVQRPGGVLHQQEGAVFASMGTAVRFFESEIRGMAANLVALERPVLWKLPQSELPGTMTLKSLDLPSHVRNIDWAPQNDVLAHPAIRAFVTHGGANSLYEAAYHAVPIVTVPQQMADQRENARKAEYHGFGMTVPIDALSVPDDMSLRDAIQQVIGNPSFQANATKVQRRLKKSRTPAEQAAEIIEHAMQTGAEDYMETRDHLFSWWQLSMLDVQLFLLAMVAAVLLMVGGALWNVPRLIRGSRSLIRSLLSSRHGLKAKAA